MCYIFKISQQIKLCTVISKGTIIKIRCRKGIVLSKKKGIKVKAYPIVCLNCKYHSRSEGFAQDCFSILLFSFSLYGVGSLHSLASCELPRQLLICLSSRF